jgi:hypothetical protein
VLVGNSRRRNVLAPSDDSLAAAAAASAELASDPAAAMVAPGIERAPVKVSVKVESDPPGAEITGDGGKLLGVTPTTLAVARSDRPLQFELSKTGYASSKHSVVPDRDVSAFLNLRVEDDPARRRAAHRKPAPTRTKAPAGAEGRMREGLSVDPFADDAKAHR